MSVVLEPVKGGILELWAEFERCWPWLEPSIFYYGKTHTKDQVFQEIMDRKAFLWGGQSCAILCRITRHPSGLVTLSGWTAGGKLKEMKLLWPRIEEWGISKGCNRVIFRGRPGWTRAFRSHGYKEWGVTACKEL